MTCGSTSQTPNPVPERATRLSANESWPQVVLKPHYRTGKYPSSSQTLTGGNLVLCTCQMMLRMITFRGRFGLWFRPSFLTLDAFTAAWVNLIPTGPRLYVHDGTRAFPIITPMHISLVQKNLISVGRWWKFGVGRIISWLGELVYKVRYHRAFVVTSLMLIMDLDDAPFEDLRWTRSIAPCVVLTKKGRSKNSVSKTIISLATFMSLSLVSLHAW